MAQPNMSLSKVNRYGILRSRYGVPIGAKLKEVNNNVNNVADPGKTLIIPHVMNENDKELLARLVHAEAKGEPYRGKVEVAGVVLNRLDSNEFPDTVQGSDLSKKPILACC